MQSRAPQLYEIYPDLFKESAIAVKKWRKRYRGNAPLWNRLFKQDRVIKEIVEAIPVIHTVQDWMSRNESLWNNEDTAGDKKMTIIDLCSGKGYLSMLLSEILPPERVGKCLLMDKAWPLCHSKPKPHHMSWEHIYGDLEDENGPRYFDAWPISLVTSKQNLKQSREIRQLSNRFSDHKGPILILAVHLCGTLSIQAIKLFQAIPAAQMLLLKPCCLPDIWHARNHDVFQIGDYCFPTKDVCASGKWTTNKAKGRWNGPPRWHLRSKFEKWCTYLHEAMGQDFDGDVAETKTEECNETRTGPQNSNIRTRIFEVPLQTKGGYQNSFLTAERLVHS